MITRTYTTTPVREVALAVAVELVNAERAGRVPPSPPLTADEYFAARLDETLDSYGRTHQAAIAARAVQAFLAAPPQAQGQLLGILGLTDYGSLPPQALSRVLGTVGLANFLALPPDDQNRCFALAGLGV
jgi:hypothetical protein